MTTPVFHMCSHFGDIELRPRGTSETLVVYENLTPVERKALDTLFRRNQVGTTGRLPRGDRLISLPLNLVATDLAGLMYADAPTLTAVRFTTGERIVRTRTQRTLDWLGRLFGGRGDDDDLAGAPLAMAGAAPVEAAAEVKKADRGCPMPTMTDLKEIKAAAVVRKFLSARQAEDFDHHRAFIAIGCDSGLPYRLTSRWSPAVEEYGVLFDITGNVRVCASNLAVPPSEELMSMLFAVEHFETAFRLGPGAHPPIAYNPAQQIPIEAVAAYEAQLAGIIPPG